MTIWTDKRIIDEHGKMYSHRADGIPTQPVYDFGDAAIAMFERMRATMDKAQELAGVAVRAALAERDSFAESAKVSEAEAIEWAAGVAEAYNGPSYNAPGRIAAAIRKGRG